MRVIEDRNDDLSLRAAKGGEVAGIRSNISYIDSALLYNCRTRQTLLIGNSGYSGAPGPLKTTLRTMPAA